MITLEIRWFRDIIARDNYTHNIEVDHCNPSSNEDIYQATMISTSGGCVIYCDNYFIRTSDGDFVQIMENQANIEIGNRPVYIKNHFGNLLTNGQIAGMISDKFIPKSLDIHRYLSRAAHAKENIQTDCVDDNSETKTCSNCESRLFISSTDGVWCRKCNRFFKD